MLDNLSLKDKIKFTTKKLMDPGHDKLPEYISIFIILK